MKSIHVCSKCNKRIKSKKNLHNTKHIATVCLVPVRRYFNPFNPFKRNIIPAIHGPCGGLLTRSY